MLFTLVLNGHLTLEDTETKFGTSVAHIIHGLVKIHNLYKKNPIIESENFRNLLISFSEDMRVILIMIADRVNLMRQIRDTEAKEAQKEVSEEASYLYAPLAHKLGLYKLKSELEAECDQDFPRCLYQTVHRANRGTAKKCRPKVPHEGTNEEHSLYLAEDEETEMQV